MRDPRYDILFEPVRIGPVTTRNRFYQVPHCSGMGHRYPAAEQGLRQIKAEGGWGVVSTQETEIHPSSDISPSNQQRLWDERDIGRLQALTEAIHAHGSLAAIQLAHNGIHTANRLSRIAPYGPADMLVDTEDPVQARAMDKSDIRAFRQWHRDAALRAKRAGFDIVYVYAGHDMTLLQHFLLKRYNQRSDEYGGSFENRLRLFREVLADTREAVGDACAVAVRFAVEELLGQDGLTHDGEGRDVIAALADEPDLWDVNLSNWANDSQTARFAQEGFQEPYIAFVKSLTRKPVVGVGRYTSPDAMVRAIRSGILDLVGAARPSIADPFLPQKIEQGRIDDIRECIGCNICTAGDNTAAPMRCTQNPTIGEEARKGWHPEIIAPLPRPASVLIVGGGPAGLEAARALAQRGAEVTIADAARQWGGRVSLEARLPGLATWARVRDWRLGQLRQASNVQMYLDSPLSAQDVLAFGMAHVAIATGAHWRCDGVGRVHRQPLPFLGGANAARVVGVDALLERGAAAVHAALAANHAQGAPTQGPVVVFDDDRYYMASVLAELLARAGLQVHFVTPAPIVAPWSEHTLEQPRIHRRLLELGVHITLLHQLAGWQGDRLDLACVYSGRLQPIACACLVPVTARLPNHGLWQALQAASHSWAEHGIASVERIGDCLAPGIIAAANYAGHAYARSLLSVQVAESACATSYDGYR
ncbi:FAD-dependent oxidoreductase [Vandammella animalimorsus]|uniref:NADH:flavin oxidoreductase n=1 Tax=Vandammella animalimorsus TaxID=2029117 RepID=A0A2A2AHL3_9BURK|nr:FAD-dependent oxidoreductase [Vandammella animalimorsus]PAT37099.1 NADH:flavin oxidoreductase [Vandammella animalimorsus]